jgi:hypothetical protein
VNKPAPTGKKAAFGSSPAAKHPGATRGSTGYRSMKTMTNNLFPLGQTFITPNAMNILNPEDVHTAIGRHAAGDWGELDKEDWAENEHSLNRHLRLLSVYRDRNGRKFWIITEADRSATTVLMPEDY